MKKKIIIALTACLVAAGSIINMHLAQNDHKIDFSLANISIMAQAVGEQGGSTCDIYCPNPGLGCIIKFSDGSSLFCPDRWP